MAIEYQDVSYGINSSRFSVGTVLCRSFSTLFQHPFVFIGLSFLAQIPGGLIIASAISSMRFSQDTTTMAQVINGVFGLVIQGAIVYGVYETLLGYGARFGKSLSRGLVRFVPLIFAVLLCFIFSLLVALGGFLLAIFIGRFSTIVSVLAVAIMLLIAAILWCKWSVFVPACVVERLGPIECLNRSSDLTRERRLKIFGLYILCFVIIYAFSFITQIMQGTFAVTLVRTFGPISGVTLFVAVQQLIMAIPMAFLHITTAASYYGLREDKEGVSVEHLINVFN